MRVLFIIPPYQYFNRFALRTEPLGVEYLASFVRKNGHEISIFDASLITAPDKLKNGLFYYGVEDHVVKETIRRFAPDVVGISCYYNFSVQDAYKVAFLVKEVDPRIVTVMGGVYPSIYKQKILTDCQAIDFAMAGEGEQSFLDLLSKLNNKRPLDIDGLLYRHNNEVIYNEKSFYIGDLNDLPLPARDLHDINRYMNSKTILYGLGQRPALSILTSRSCPMRCAFCNMWQTQGPRWRFRSPENVLEEIDEILNKYRAEHVFIMDDNFNFDPQRVKIICRGIIKRGYRFRWNTPNGISVKNVDGEMAHLMKEAGCANVCLGIESGSEYMRNRVMQKNVSDQDIISAADHFRKAKIPVGALLIIGMPGENRERFRESIKFLNGLPLSFISPSFAIPFRGTRLFNNLVKDHIIEDDFDIGIDSFKYPAFSTPDFDKKELLSRRRQLIASFHFSHLPLTLMELMTGRLNWISLCMLKRNCCELLN